MSNRSNLPEATERPSRIRRYIITEPALNKTEVHLRIIGQFGVEAVAYWLGTFHKEDAVIDDVLFADDFVSNAYSWGYVHLDVRVTNKIAEAVHKRSKYLLIQLHTHPGDAFHSCTDDNHPISHRVGFISIVIPNFGQTGMSDLAAWGVYEHKGLGKWKRLATRTVRKKFVISK